MMGNTHFKAMSVLGCERGNIAYRTNCKHNCCDGENCLTWLDKKFRDLAAYEDTNLTPSDIADLRNELCLKCGRYKTEYKGACDGCRWRKNEKG